LVALKYADLLQGVVGDDKNSIWIYHFKTVYSPTSFAGWVEYKKPSSSTPTIKQIVGAKRNLQESDNSM
jgi:hypothetical protein